MAVIDVDSHFYEPLDWLETRFPELAAELPRLDPVTLVATTAFGDIISTLPSGVRPADPLAIFPKSILDLLRGSDPAVRESVVRGFLDAIEATPGAWRASDRIAFLDREGIDRQFVLPTFAFNPLSRVRRARPERAPEFFAAFNTWALETLDGHTERLIPVAAIDFETMDRSTAIEELTRMRRAGSRSFTFWAAPIGGKSLGHPDLDWIWAASEDLGMLPMIHVGAGKPSIDLGWLDNGRPFPSNVLTYLGLLHQIAEVTLGELLFGGVFERHPNLRVLVCELGTDWVPRWLARLDRVLAFGKGRGEPLWSASMRPSEMARRSIRVSPLDLDPVAAVLHELDGDMIVFASDYPHPEGGSNAVARYRATLDTEAMPAHAERFFGGTLAADLALGA